MELIVLGIVAGLFAASYAVWKRTRETPEGRQKGPPAALPAVERTIHTLQIGDVATYLDGDYLVEGVLTLDEGGRVTRGYRVSDGSRVRWLWARPGEDAPWWLEEATGPAKDAAGADTLVHGSTSYRLEMRAGVQVMRAGALGSGKSGERARLCEYVSAGEERLVTLAWAEGERVDLLVGERLRPGALDLLPGH